MVQDGGYNPISKELYAYEDELQDVRKVFEDSTLPNKTIVKHRINRGTAINIDDAIRIPLRTHDVVLLIAEDSECSPYLMEHVVKAADFYNTSNIGAVGFYTPIPIWAMLTWKDKWKKIHKLRKPFLDYVKKYDYRLRPIDELADKYKVLTEDASRQRAIKEAGLEIVSYPKNLINHIGQVGLHYTPEGFKERGYDKIELEGRDNE